VNKIASSIHRIGDSFEKQTIVSVRRIEWDSSYPKLFVPMTHFYRPRLARLCLSAFLTFRSYTNCHRAVARKPDAQSKIGGGVRATCRGDALEKHFDIGDVYRA
jgi:hypothetical protein